jgi:hypothetical protein
MPPATADLLWRAKLAGEPRRNPWQLQRIHPIAFQAAKRPWALAVNRAPLAPSSHRSARIARMERPDPCGSMTPRRS